MVVRVLDYVSSCDSNDQGEEIRALISNSLETNDTITLDFSGVTNVTSSFVNSAFVSLSPNYSFDFLKSKIKIERVNRQIGNMIRTRMSSKKTKPSDMFANL